MSKLAYFFITLVGAVPAGGTFYLIVQHFFDRGFSGPPVLVGVVATTAVALFATILTPLMVLFWYKSPNADAAKPAAAAVADKEEVNDKKPAAPAKGKKGKDTGFDDAIPDDFDEDELNESAGDDDFEAGDEDFEYDDDEFEEEEEQPKKKKKK